LRKTTKKSASRHSSTSAYFKYHWLGLMMRIIIYCYLLILNISQVNAGVIASYQIPGLVIQEKQHLVRYRGPSMSWRSA